jgi:hypothetical protein
MRWFLAELIKKTLYGICLIVVAQLSTQTDAEAIELILYCFGLYVVLELGQALAPAVRAYFTGLFGSKKR